MLSCAETHNIFLTTLFNSILLDTCLAFKNIFRLLCIYDQSNQILLIPKVINCSAINCFSPTVGLTLDKFKNFKPVMAPFGLHFCWFVCLCFFF